MTKSLPLSLIAALGENRVIGVDNSMPWHLPGDFKYFKATTLGKPIIMGRKTWDSLGRPLPGRLNIVVSRQADLVLEGAEVYPSLEAAVVRAEEWAKEQGVDELMLIGGAQLYAQGMAQADRLYLTRVALSPEGDAWFPEFDLNQWKLVSKRRIQRKVTSRHSNSKSGKKPKSIAGKPAPTGFEVKHILCNHH